MKIGCQPACPVIPGHTGLASEGDLVIYYVCRLPPPHSPLLTDTLDNRILDHSYVVSQVS